MLKPTFTKADVHKLFQQKARAVEMVMIRQLQVLGEKCVTLARTLNTYTDDTGNLRSSVGYAIYAGGSAVSENFESFQAGGTGSLGKARAQELAAKHAKSNAMYYQLVVVAGMPYAEYVEAKGYDVLTPAEHLAEREFPKLMTKLTNKIGKGI